MSQSKYRGKAGNAASVTKALGERYQPVAGLHRASRPGAATTTPGSRFFRGEPIEGHSQRKASLVQLVGKW